MKPEALAAHIFPGGVAGDDSEEDEFRVRCISSWVLVSLESAHCFLIPFEDNDSLSNDIYHWRSAKIGAHELHLTPKPTSESSSQNVVPHNSSRNTRISFLAHTILSEPLISRISTFEPVWKPVIPDRCL